MPIEIDDLGIRIIGYDVMFKFYDPGLNLQCSISLQPDNTLALCGVPIGSGLTEAAASQIFVRLDGNNWNLWQPAGGTQSIVGNFNLAGEYEYKIGGVHALSIHGTFGGVARTRSVFVGDGAEAGGGDYSVKIGYQAMAAGYDLNSVSIGANVMLTNTTGADECVLLGSALLGAATAGLNIFYSNIIGAQAARAADGNILNSDVSGFEAIESLGAGGVATSVLMGYRIGRGAVYIEDTVGIGPNIFTSSSSVVNTLAAGENAMQDIDTSEGDVALGFFAIGEAADTAYVTAVGTGAHGWASGSYNFAGGAYALRGTNTGHTVTNMTAVGARAGWTLADGMSGGVFLGFESGYFETGSSKLFIDNIRRASEADARVKALVYGVFAVATADQYFTINGHLVALEDATSAHFISTVAAGTQPYAATSTMLNTNLNADAWDSLHAPANAVGALTNNGAGALSWAAAGAGTVGGNGTAGRVAQWAAGGVDIEDSFLVGPAANVLTFVAAGAFTLTVPATGTATLGTGTEHHVALWSDANTVKALGDLGDAGEFLRSGGVGVDPTWAVPAGGGGAGSAVSDPAFQVEGALAVAVNVDGSWIIPRNATILYVYIYCKDPGSANETIVDVNKNGVTIFTTQGNRPSLAWNDPDQVAKSGVPDITALAENDVLEVDIDAIGTDAAGLTIIVALDLGTYDASDITYTPAVDADWAGAADPGNVDAGLDQLAVFHGPHFYGQNLVKNSPGQIIVDGAEPQWWDDVANATITDEDAAGEACSDKFERVFKVVTIADDVYGYQIFTFADEELLDAGVTIVSLGVWVWCAAATTASIAIYGANLGSQESGQHTGGSGWELLVVEGITLDAGDTSIQVRLICDTGTAFFAAPMQNVGPRAMPWRARTEKFIPLLEATQLDLTGGSVAWTSTDCTANTNPLTVGIAVTLRAFEIDGSVQSRIAVSHDDALITDSFHTVIARTSALNMYFYGFNSMVRCSDSQEIRYEIREVDADNDLATKIYITGYWTWA